MSPFCKLNFTLFAFDLCRKIFEHRLSSLNWGGANPIFPIPDFPDFGNIRFRNWENRENTIFTVLFSEVY
jgi:hypothetical protein